MYTLSANVMAILSANIMAQVGIIQWVAIGIAFCSMVIGFKMMGIASKKFDIDKFQAAMTLVKSKANQKDLDELKTEVRDKISRSEFMVYIDGIKTHIDDKTEETLMQQKIFHEANIREHDQIIKTMKSMNDSILIMKAKVNE